MSAGICIVNKNAIALAADSTVTIGQHLAIHNSSNKLFELTKVAPVGVIIYSNAELKRDLSRDKFTVYMVSEKGLKCDLSWENFLIYS